VTDEQSASQLPNLWLLKMETVNDANGYVASKRRRRDWQNRHRARAALQRLGLGD